MTGFMFLLDHPFFAVTDKDGRFEIDGLPDGAYDLTVWHETFGEKVVSIRVEGGAGSTEISFEA